MGLHVAVELCLLLAVLTLGGLYIRERNLHSTFRKKVQTDNERVQTRLLWAQWWMRNAFEYPDQADKLRVSSLRTVAEMAILSENIDVLADLLSKLPEDDVHEGRGFNVAWQAGREVIAARATGRPPWVALPLPSDPSGTGSEHPPPPALEPGHDSKLRRARLAELFRRLRDGVLTDDETGELIARPRAPTPS